eukprot:scaffold108371_cov19-Tisochrysis_lutea.AAC.1
MLHWMRWRHVAEAHALNEKAVPSGGHCSRICWVWCREEEWQMRSMHDVKAMPSGGHFVIASVEYDVAEKNGRELHRKSCMEGSNRRAIDLARREFPSNVIQLEEEWGDWLMSQKAMDAAINHYIESGSSLK